MVNPHHSERGAASPKPPNDDRKNRKKTPVTMKADAIRNSFLAGDC